jgi:hypothetical protein
MFDPFFGHAERNKSWQIAILQQKEGLFESCSNSNLQLGRIHYQLDEITRSLVPKDDATPHLMQASKEAQTSTMGVSGSKEHGRATERFTGTNSVDPPYRKPELLRLSFDSIKNQQYCPYPSRMRVIFLVLFFFGLLVVLPANRAKWLYMILQSSNMQQGIAGMLSDLQTSSSERNPATVAGAKDLSELDISVIGDPVIVWSSVDTLHKCHIVDVPDIPTRAYAVQDDNNDPNSNMTIHMIQGSTSFYNMTGPSLLNVSRQCKPQWNKTANADPAMFAANEFLDSTIAFDNGTVISLSHVEYPGNRYDNCPGPAYPYCWSVTMGLMVSHDFGTTWHHARPPPHHLVAAVPYKYNVSALANGWGDPTNIVRHPYDGYYYVAAWNRNQVGLQAPGVCMMRTSSLMDPSSWRGWNGTHYSVAFQSPYHRADDPSWNPASHICTVLQVDSTILNPTECNPFGLVWSTTLEVFLMTWDCISGHGPFYMTTSSDLIHWSSPQPFYNKSNLPDVVLKRVTSMHYPSLMDASAPTEFRDNNYYTVGEKPHLFWVSFGHNVYADGRSAWATPLHIQARDQKAPALFGTSRGII